jgi:BlaI family transcriptional regulator, penicillinase repressor
MSSKPEPPLSKRERQIMDVLYVQGEATALEVLSALPDPPGKTAVRTLLKILEGKGHVTHREAENAYVYAPRRPREHAGRSAMRRVLDVFFGGSLEQAVAAHLGDDANSLSEEELKRLAALVRKARKQDA